MIRIDEPARNLARQQELERQLDEIHARHMAELLPIMNELNQLKSHMYPSVEDVITEIRRAFEREKLCHRNDGAILSLFK